MIQNGVLFSDLQTKEKKVKIAHNHLDYFKASQLQQLFADSFTRKTSFWRVSQLQENYMWNKVYLRLAYGLVIVLKWA